MKDGDVMEDLAKAALRKLDIEFASIIYRYLGDVGKYYIVFETILQTWFAKLCWTFVTFLELSTKSKGIFTKFLIKKNHTTPHFRSFCSGRAYYYIMKWID